MQQSHGIIPARLSIDVGGIRKESNQQERLSVSTRALFLRILLELGSQYQNELQSALGGKYDVKLSLRINLDGEVLERNAEIETIGVT